MQHPIIEWLIKEAFKKCKKSSIDDENEVLDNQVENDDRGVLDYLVENVQKYDCHNSLVEGLDYRDKLALEEVKYQRAQVGLLEIIEKKLQDLIEKELSPDDINDIAFTWTVPFQPGAEQVDPSPYQLQYNML